MSLGELVQGMLSYPVWGLAIRNLRYFNEALLGKRLWRFGYEREALWRRVIRAKYGVEEGDWCSNSVPGSYGVSLWKTISSGLSTFSHYIQFHIGDRTRVKFWHDFWCGDNPLSTCFPDLFRISNY